MRSANCITTTENVMFGRALSHEEAVREHTDIIRMHVTYSGQPSSRVSEVLERVKIPRKVESYVPQDQDPVPTKPYFMRTIIPFWEGSSLAVYLNPRPSGHR